MSRLSDLALGTKFALSGGREGWTRTLLTAVGVGLGVALLLATTAIPSALSKRDARDNARNDFGAAAVSVPSADPLLIGRTDTKFQGKDIRGRLLQPEGPKAPVPPGLSGIPGDREMAVSPELKSLLDSPGGALLRERLPYKVTGTIKDTGLLGPHEMAYYAGSDALGPRLAAEGDQSGVTRVTGFVDKGAGEKIDPVLALLIVIIFVVLLMPVAVFIAAAVRFGGDRRDRRLAALRLVGADRRTTRWIAAGEALAGSALGLVLGAAFFMIARQFVGDISVNGLNVFPADIDPNPLLALAVAVVVPTAAVGVTLLALRGVTIEPLGVVRNSVPRKRRVWWRVLPPLAGLALLAPMTGRGRDNGTFNQVQVVSGTVLLLIGVTALLPWLVEAVVRRLGGGGVSWQLAVRRLQLTSGTAARLVNGIAVAVAGAIALQMMFSAIEGDYVKRSGADTNRAQMSVPMGEIAPERAARQIRALKDTKGVTGTTTLGYANLGEKAKDPNHSTDMTIGGCAELREVAELPSCKDGDVFLARGGEYSGDPIPAGAKLYVDPSYSDRSGVALPWTVPANAQEVQARTDPSGYRRNGILATPGAVRSVAKAPMRYTTYVRLDPRDQQAADRVLNSATAADPLTVAYSLNAYETSNRFAGVRKGLYIGATAVLLLIGASLLVSTLEQLRDRKKLLSALVAFGTRRTTLSWSVLWQTAVPVALGLALATGVGLALGAVLLRMVGRQIVVDWLPVGAMVGIGAGVVLLVTALSLPSLWKLMRPDGLRTE
ncbi:FtsX-like permease family protein [Streptomyces olivoreticuli]|uniref:ABC transporter permease n=1 Tax=Streptomyces olivoreticuli TaxID=68246 RepID=UPI00265A5EB0|nr:FtsX-like permease family protein [Streptomyces olivoreticuli]WKK23876.1 FtsX-like permease family protein [Streptomyces olivoreticuli]